MRVLSPAATPWDAAILHDRFAADDGRDRPAPELPAVVQAVVGIRSQLRRDHLTLEVQVDDRQVAVVAGADVPLPVVDVEDARRRGGETLADPLQADAPLVSTLEQEDREGRRVPGKPCEASDMRLSFVARCAARDRMRRRRSCRLRRRRQRVEIVAGLGRRVRLAERAQVRVDVCSDSAGTSPGGPWVARVRALSLLDRQAGRRRAECKSARRLLGEVDAAEAVLGLGDRRLRPGPVPQRVPPLLLETAPVRLTSSMFSVWQTIVVAEARGPCRRWK